MLKSYTFKVPVTELDHARILREAPPECEALVAEYDREIPRDLGCGGTKMYFAAIRETLKVDADRFGIKIPNRNSCTWVSNFGGPTGWLVVAFEEGACPRASIAELVGRVWSARKKSVGVCVTLF